MHLHVAPAPWMQAECSKPPFLLQLVPAVTELIIAELLYLQYRDRTKPMFLYINSTGTSRADGETVSICKAGCWCQARLLARPAATSLLAEEQVLARLPL